MSGASRTAAIALVLVLSAVLGRLAYDRATPAVLPEVNDPAGPLRPEFSLAGPGGKTYGPGDWAGKVLVLNFWASWCLPCREEIPDLMALQSAYGGRGLQIVGIAIDEPKAARDYATRLALNYPSLDGASEGQRVAEDYGNHIGALPYTVIVDRHGRIAYAKPGQIARDEAEAILVPLLAAPPA